MPTPVRFTPHPDVANALELGIGDLTYDDGNVRFLPGDPELAGQVMSYQDLLDPASLAPPVVQTAAPAATTVPPPAPSVALPAMGPPMAPPADSEFIPHVPSGAPGTTAAGSTAFSPRLPEDQVAIDAAADSRLPPVEGPAGMPDIAAEARGEVSGATPPPMAPTPVSAPMGSAAPMGGAPPGGSDDLLMVTQRQGRLDPDVAARQAEERSAQNVQDQLTLQQSRDAAFAVERADIREKRLQLRAQEEERARQVQEHQAKVKRYRDEQRQVADAGIDRDLISAQGGLGAAMSVIGAALLGATGSDAGLRMIESTIERHVRTQMGRKDSKLRALADQIGSEEQLLQSAKAQLYKASADRAEQLQRLTKSDAYMAATPGIIQELRSKQLAAEQAAERESLGKTIETLPAPSKGVDPAALQKLGEVRKSRMGGDSIATRGEQALGLEWDPKTQSYTNAKEVLKRGFQGKGNLEQWLPDFVYSTFGGVTAEGYQVRGVAESMAYATIRQLQPVGPISNADIQAAVKANSLDTEDGMIKALARIRVQNAREEQHDRASFTDAVVDEYERVYQRGGGRNINQTQAAESTATATSADIAAELQRRRQKPAGAEGQPDGQAARATIDDVRGSIQAQAGKELPPEGLRILFAQAGHETEDGKRFVGNNFFGHKATGSDKFVEAETTEGSGDKAERVKEKFRSFGGADESVAAHLSLLKRRYPKAWTALENGDENAYVEALVGGGYFTDDQGTYLRGIQRRLGD